MNIFKKIGVYGGGGWGCALAIQAARIHDKVTLYLRSQETAAEILNNRTNNKYLKNINFPTNIIPTTNLKDILTCDLIIIAAPSGSFTEIIDNLKAANLSSNVTLLIATKGLSKNPVELLSDKLRSSIQNPFAFIAGPNFALQVAQDLLTPVTIASENIELAEKISVAFKSRNFLPTTTDDIITIQIAGAIKNIIAIKSGMYEGFGYKENAKAGLITDGLKEIMNLSLAMGGDFKTLLQSAVLGDLMLTCYSNTSRNTNFGYEFAISRDPKSFLKNHPHLVEGRESAPLVLELAKRYNLKMPIVSSIVEALES